MSYSQSWIILRQNNIFNSITVTESVTDRYLALGPARFVLVVHTATLHNCSWAIKLMGILPNYAAVFFWKPFLVNDDEIVYTVFVKIQNTDVTKILQKEPFKITKRHITNVQFGRRIVSMGWKMVSLLFLFLWNWVDFWFYLVLTVYLHWYIFSGS